ncbi:M14 family zinc carboxypeptidase [Faecalibacter rhinopitheci]|uniref:Peptidase M14 n=1 Tax=Faecalibacter rhinopitheci TaxID=2779678 RepID=A0A8J7KHD3_9FLAO|nr:M14 family zinc carboxypeptidase [Faecalibacter rhinopitheci]MBF0596211.1 peptidase M14 [Faecalibacter rhinopitheci]
MLKIKELEDLYPSYKQDGFDNKWLNFEGLLDYFSKISIEKKEIGKSFLGNSIYKISVGKGSKRILIWSQMHGNESTGTRSMFDVLNFLNSKHIIAEQILHEITIDFIPMLNPDGANVNTRRNAIGIDPNRDFLAQQSLEIKILLQQVESENYITLFNLHDQRTIFNVGETAEPATLSFLAPSYNIEEEMNDVRQHTMGIIQAMNTELQKVIPGKIGRYTSEFYPMATGDNFTKMGYPCILFEAGHYPNDYQRNVTRKYNALAIITGLYTISMSRKLDFSEYELIPKNGSKFLDVIIRNIKIKNGLKESLVDIGIYYEDIYYKDTNKVAEKGSITEIGDLRKFFGHLDLDAKGEIFNNESGSLPMLNQIATFTVGEYNFINGRIHY